MKNTVTYLLRNVKKDLWRKVKIKAIKMGVSIKQLIIDTLKEKVKK